MCNTSPFPLIIMSWFLTSGSVTKNGRKITEINGLKFLDEYVIPYNKHFDNTTVGGLSGIDYDSKKGVYYLICDDRSDKNPPKFYTVNIEITKNKIDTVIFLETIFLKDKVGNFYPNSQQNPSHTPDPEAMRFNSQNNTFIWSSEGERIVNNQQTVLENPAITEINTTGNYIDTFQIPWHFHMQATENGPRQNGVFEGVTFADSSTLVSA